MSDPTARTLRLLSLLQTHKFWPGSELAGELGVSERTLRRDIDRLRELGYPVDASPGVAGGYRLAAGAHVPPLVFDDDEAVAIVVGLRAAAGASVAGIEDTSLRALAKLEQVLPDRLRRRVSALHQSTTVMPWTGPETVVDPECFSVLATACRDREEARFAYTSRGGEATHRLVQPKQMVSVGRRWYLVAWDVRRDDWRTFRLDRMTECRLAGVRFEDRELPTTDAAAYVARSLRQTPSPFRATVRVTATADEVRDVARWLDSDVTEIDDGRVELQLRADSLGWLVSQCTTLAVNFPIDVDADDEFLELLATTGTRLTGANRPPA